MIDLTNYKIIPTIKINNAENAYNLADALVKGGIPIAEITFRTDAAEEAIKEMNKYPGILVGAGSVINLEQAEKAINAGAKFIVCPGLNVELVKYCQQEDVTIVPGVATATEIVGAVNLGCTFLKYFPVETLGGVKMIKAISAPFPGIKFMPTGGVTIDNMKDYFALNCVQAVGGTWMASEKWIDNHEFEKITEACRKSIEVL